MLAERALAAFSTFRRSRLPPLREIQTGPYDVQTRDRAGKFPAERSRPAILQSRETGCKCLVSSKIQESHDSARTRPSRLGHIACGKPGPQRNRKNPGQRRDLRGAQGRNPGHRGAERVREVVAAAIVEPAG